MKQLLLVAALLVCVWPTGSLAGDPPAPGDHPGNTAVVSRPAEAPDAKVKVFIRPETGEILTREQWEALGIQNEESEATLRSSPEPLETENTPAIFKGKRIDLENGDYAIVVNAPDMVETKAWFDDEGKTHIRCTH